MTSIQDETDFLILSHYDQCDNHSDRSIKQERGVIRDINGNLVCQSFGYTHEYNTSDEEWKTMVQYNIQNCHIFIAEEGTLLRLFCYENRWYLSTHKRIDAFTSHWSSTSSFGDLFVEALDYYYQKGEGKGKLDYLEKDHLLDVFCAGLDTDRVYTFMLRTNADTRIVCQPPTVPTVYFAGQFYKGMYLEGNPTTLPWPTRVMFTAAEDLSDYIESFDPVKCPGVIVVTPDQNVFKVMTPGYKELTRIRGCEPSLYRVYMRVRQNEDELKTFLQLFPESKTTHMMTTIEQSILALARKICNFYMRRFVHKEHVVVDKNYYYIMRLAHQWHSESREQNILSVQKFLEILDKQDHNFLYKLLSI